MTEEEYWRAHTILTNEVTNTIEAFYVDREINEFAGNSPDALRAMNSNPLFWTIATHALQTTFMITLGRIFDRDPRSHSIHRLISETAKHPEYFSKAALRRRKLGNNSDDEPEWLADYLLASWEPDAAALEDFGTALKPSSEKYDASFKDIRHKLYAHRDMLDRGGIQALVSKGLIVDLEAILFTLHDLLDCIWQLGYNGAKPCPGARKYDYEKYIRSETKKTLDRLVVYKCTSEEPD